VINTLHVAQPLLDGANNMKPIKIVVAIAAVLGLLATFVLPYISASGMSLKFWDFHSMPSGFATGLLNGPKQVYVAIVGFLLMGSVAMHAIVNGRFARWAGIVGAVGGLFALATEGVRKGLTGAEGMSTAIGGKLLFIAAIVGLVASIIGAVKPETGRV
jgi:hypothetical protein